MTQTIRQSCFKFENLDALDCFLFSIRKESIDLLILLLTRKCINISQNVELFFFFSSSAVKKHRCACTESTDPCMQVRMRCHFVFLKVNIYLEGYICLYGEECKLLWICMFARERKRGRDRKGERERWAITVVANGRRRRLAQRSVVALAVRAWMRLVLQFLQRTCPSRGQHPWLSPSDSREPQSCRTETLRQSTNTSHEPHPLTRHVRTLNETFTASVTLQETVCRKACFGFISAGESGRAPISY